MTDARSMGRAPVVSIVTPTRNRASFLRATINSIRRQTFQEFEHIVVDGGSTDGTLELLRECEGAYPMRWLSEPDSGMYDAVNKGLRLASGDILAYLNDDDLYFPWSLATVVEQLDRHPDVDVIFGDLLGVDDVTGAQTLHFIRPFDLDYLCRFGFLGQPAVFWRRRVIETEGLFDQSLRYVADCDYWMRIGARRTFRKVNEFLAVQREHPDTLRATGDKVWTELALVRKRYVSFDGLRHRRARRRERIKSAIWSRLFLLAALLQASLPRPLSIGPWAQLFGSGTLRLNRRRALLRLVPVVARRVPPDIALPDRHWVEVAESGLDGTESGLDGTS